MVIINHVISCEIIVDIKLFRDMGYYKPCNFTQVCGQYKSIWSRQL